jgi:hypothetical protein
MSENKLRDFLLYVAKDKELPGLFNRLADTLDRSGMSEKEQSAFLSRDSERIRKLLGGGDNVNMIYRWFKDRPYQ